MIVDFRLRENENATFCDSEIDGMPSVGQWISLTRNDLRNVPSTSPEATSTYLITRIRWAGGGANSFQPNRSTRPARAIVYVSLDDESNVLHCGFDGYARLCGSAHVIANCLGATMQGEVSDLEPGETLVFVDPTFRTVTAWHRPNNGGEAKETNIRDRIAERIAREWWTDGRAKTGASHTWAALKVLIKKYKAEEKAGGET